MGMSELLQKRQCSARLMSLTESCCQSSCSSSLLLCGVERKACWRASVRAEAATDKHYTRAAFLDSCALRQHGGGIAMECTGAKRMMWQIMRSCGQQSRLQPSHRSATLTWDLHSRG